MSISTDQEHTDPRPEPTSFEEALARRVNMTPEQAWALAVKAKWGFTSGDGDSPYEYDQDDRLVVAYDDLHDLASVAIEAMKFLGGPFDSPD